MLALMKSTNPDTPCVIPIHIPGNGLSKIPVPNTNTSEIIIVQFKMIVFLFISYTSFPKINARVSLN